jgi:hypothetical protein
MRTMKAASNGLAAASAHQVIQAIMIQSERFSSPAWTCFRAELRRRWHRRILARMGGVLLLILCVQVAVSLGLEQISYPEWTVVGLTPFSWFFWLVWLLTAMGLASPTALAFSGGDSLIRVDLGSHTILWNLLLEGIIALPLLACRFLMPAYAATSIAPDREQRRIPELILAGLSPQQILVAKGLAAVLPFLGAAFIALIGADALCLRYPFSAQANDFVGVSPKVLLLIQSGMTAVGLLFSAAIQVCISTVSRQTGRALLMCYAVECVLIPFLSLAMEYGWTAALFMGPQGRAGFLVVAPQFTILFLQDIALIVLWLWALRALAYPDETTLTRTPAGRPAPSPRV